MALPAWSEWFNRRAPRRWAGMAALRVGDTASLERTLGPDQVQAFADLSGDHNPLHVDPAFAAGTRFGRPIVHGPFTLTLLMTLLGTRLPGPGTVLVAVESRFLAPVFVGDTVEARVTLAELAGRRATVALECRRGRDVVVEGRALVSLPREA
jgi:acyl dehydratase